MVRLFVAAMFLAMPLVASAQESLCPPREPVAPDADDPAMHEREFTRQKARESITFFREDFAKRIWGPEPVRDFSAWSGHYISYANSLRFIEGALLKEHALLLKAQAALAARVDPKGPEANKAKATIGAIKRPFDRMRKPAPSPARTGPAMLREYRDIWPPNCHASSAKMPA